MSLPRDLLDQLLSGYLDDALSNDERTRVEQLLRDDPEVARELQELSDLREILREIHREDQRFQLGPNFADRVLKATVDQATAEGLSEDHPVRLLSQQPSTSVVTRHDFPLAKMAGVVVALAASVIVAIAVFRTPPDPEHGGLVQNDPPPTVDPIDVPPQDVIEQEAPGPPAPIEQLVKDTPTNKITSPVEVPEAVEMPVNDANSISVPSNTNNIAELSPRPPSPSPMDLDPKLLAQSLVMVVDVRQTEAGRGSNAVGAAMVKAGIKPADERKIDESIVDFGKDLIDENQSVSVLYLEDAGKKIDNFINAMVADLDGIESVGFSYAADAPIIGLVNELKSIDPTTVRHGASWQLTDDEGNGLQLLAQELGSRDFSEVKREGAGFPGNGVEGPDIKARIFVLIR